MTEPADNRNVFETCCQIVLLYNYVKIGVVKPGNIYRCDYAILVHRAFSTKVLKIYCWKYKLIIIYWVNTLALWFYQSVIIWSVKKFCLAIPYALLHVFQNRNNLAQKIRPDIQTEVLAVLMVKWNFYVHSVLLTRMVAATNSLCCGCI